MGVLIRLAGREQRGPPPWGAPWQQLGKPETSSPLGHDPHPLVHHLEKLTEYHPCAAGMARTPAAAPSEQKRLCTASRPSKGE